MSIETLKQDLKENLASLASIEATPEALKAHLQNSLWPFFEAALDEMDEIDGAVQDMLEEMPDMIHEETAEVFAQIITKGIALMAELRKRAGNDPRILKLVKEWSELAAQGTEILEETTLPDGEDDEDEDEDEGDEPDEGPATATAEPAAASGEGSPQ